MKSKPYARDIQAGGQGVFCIEPSLNTDTWIKMMSIVG
jgi:hypothetical protein